MSDKLILVEKDGQQISIHPGTLENHKQLGWIVVDEAPSAPEPKAAPAAKTSIPPVRKTS